jgi:hypothetical protein
MFPNLPIAHSQEILELRSRLDRGIQQLSNPGPRRDLVRLLKAANSYFDRLDRELITCRRLNHYTRQYQELHIDCMQQFRTVSKYLLQALLMSKP